MADTITPNVPIAISASLNVDDVSVLARSTETVPDASNGMDQRIVLVVIDLSTHPSDVDIDDIGQRIEMKVPDVLQKHGAGYNAAFIAHQILQELEFPRGQVDTLAAPAGGPRDQVDREIANAQDGLLGDGVTAPTK